MDISDRRRGITDKRLEPIRRELDRLHDPLTVLLGNLQLLLRDEQLDSTTAEQLALLETQAHRLRRGLGRALQMVDSDPLVE